MMKTIKRKPNFLLQHEREWHSLSQSQVAEYIGTTPLSVSRWERGLVLPGPHFRRALCTLFNKNPCELGFMPTEERNLPYAMANANCQGSSVIQPIERSGDK
ncbi:MAG: helix-turn-helix transcriptional regulator [Ktedonobacteraceae bacterium]|nr:helix-turn-helix transcriptional regulator [Ktedonobacteraceae bacterium]